MTRTELINKIKSNKGENIFTVCPENAAIDQPAIDKFIGQAKNMKKEDIDTLIGKMTTMIVDESVTAGGMSIMTMVETIEALKTL